MTREVSRISHAQMSAVASRLGHLLESIAKLRSAGVDGETLELLEAHAKVLAEQIDLQALLIDVLVTIDELQPKQRGSLGALDSNAAELLDREASTLHELGSRLLDELSTDRER